MSTKTEDQYEKQVRLFQRDIKELLSQVFISL